MGRNSLHPFKKDRRGEKASRGTKIFTPKGRFGAKQDMFEWHDSQGDDKCHLIENVIAYIILPEPLK